MSKPLTKISEKNIHDTLFIFFIRPISKQVTGVKFVLYTWVRGEFSTRLSNIWNPIIRIKKIRV